MKIDSNIKNIIFDWGGVIININYDATRKAFIKLGMVNFDEKFSQFQQNEIFDQLETGKITGEEFFSRIAEMLPEGTEEDEMRSAWNAMLLDFPEENYQLLQEQKNNFRTFLFSNTNEPHLSYYFPKLEEKYGINSMDPLFEKAYYSCRLGMRKPHPQAFLKIVEENGLIPSETLFIDDSPQHIEGASTAGLKTHHLKEPERLIDLFNSRS